MGKRILLADDSVTIHKVVELTFLDEDYTVEAVASGDEAIARLETEAPDLVIADVHMPPGASGYDVCAKVRELHPGVPVLLLAGTFEPFDAEKASAADAHLKKPFDSQKLLQTVHRLVGEADAEAAAVAGGETAEMPSVPAAAGPAAESAVAAGEGSELAPETVETIARRVAELLGDEVVREVAWEVVPDLAEVVIKDRLRELEGEVE